MLLKYLPIILKTSTNVTWCSVILEMSTGLRVAFTRPSEVRTAKCPWERHQDGQQYQGGGKDGSQAGWDRGKGVEATEGGTMPLSNSFKKSAMKCGGGRCNCR